jgi:PPOX class probable F420-dependent enzyme
LARYLFRIDDLPFIGLPQLVMRCCRIDIQLQEVEMSNTIPDNFRDLFTKRAFGQLATLMKDGTPQVTPVWVDHDGTYVRVNSAKGRIKDKNIRRNPKVAISIQDPDNPYRYIAIRGTVIEVTENGADDHIDSLAKKYMGKDKYPLRQPGEVRVMYKIKPEGVSTMG